MMKRLIAPILALLILTGCAGNSPAQPSASAPPAAAPVSTPPVSTPPQAAYTGPVEPQDHYRTYYEIFVGSFYDSDGDGYGDLAGITEKLDYLNDNRADSDTSLHVTGLWLMPIHPSPTYHKYDVTDYYAVDPQYGTMADFEALAAACAQRGIALILDLVVNHTSNEHPWFEAALDALAAGETGGYIDWYQFSREALPKYHAAPGAAGRYYNGQFWSGMPDLNLDNPAVRDEILDIARFWLQKGATGFRLDAVTSYYEGNSGKNAEFMGWLQRELGPEVYLVGEAWTDGGTIQSLYTGGITSLFNFPLSQSTGAIISGVRSGDGASIARAAERWNADIRAANPNAIDAPFLTNHDNTRSAGALMNNLQLQKQAAAVYLLLPGSPFLYYGEEIAMRGGGDRDEDKRMPFTWSVTESTGVPNPPPGAQNDTAVAAGAYDQLANPDSLTRFYVEVIRLRNRYPAIARGTLTALDTGEKAVCAYEVTWQGETLYIYHNVGKEAVSVDATGAILDTLTADGAAPALSDGTLTLPPYSTAILGG